jgi:cytochrome b involved in lipid metabolism
MAPPDGPTTRQVIAEAELTNARLGHDNSGSLSTTSGFVPVQPPRLAFPASHAAWDEAAAELPALHRDLRVRAALDALPVLPADAAFLPDAYLQRAATVLGVLGHAWVHGTPDGRTDLPESVARPWAEVRRRLGRSPHPVLSYVDLIVHNWRFVDGAVSPLQLEDLRLLVPAVDNQEERVFYLSQLEILARCAPIVPLVADAQDAVLDDEPQALRTALDGITDVLRTTTRRSLSSIDPRPHSATHVDPVVWAKTVAPFAVPLRPGVLGPSGTASPVFNLLDSFLGRPSHASQLGREILLHRQGYPRHWRGLLDAVDRVSVAEHVATRCRPDLTTSFEAVRSAYAGEDGFLGRHRRKVYGYLSVAFTVGRSVTIGGFSGAPREHAWNEVDEALRQSQTERRAEVAGRPPAQPRRRAVPPPPTAEPARCREVSVADLALHNDARHGWWTAIGGRVHDVTGLLEHHPGGRAVLQAHAGLEASDAFLRAHVGRSGVERLLRSTEIGRLTRPATTCAAYPAWVRALGAVVELQNTYRLDRSLGSGTDLCVPDGEPASAFQTDRAADTHVRFVDGYLPQLTVELLRPLAGATPAPPGRGGSTGASAATCWRDRMDLLDRRVATVKRLLCVGVRRCEAGGDADHAALELSRIARRAVAVSLGDPATDLPRHQRS